MHKPVKILFIGEIVSSHAQSWINLVTSDPNFDVLALDISNDPVQGELPFRTVKWKQGHRRLAQVYRQMNKISLQKCAQFKPDIIHTLGLFPASHFYIQFREKISAHSIWIAQARGGPDLALNKDNPAIRPLIEAILSECDHFIADNQLNYEFAQELGLHRDKVCPYGFLPGTGGISKNDFIQSAPTKKEKIILWPKAYTNIQSDGMPVVEALAIVMHELPDYRLIATAATPDIEYWLKKKLVRHLDRVEIHPRLSRKSLLDIFNRARILLAPSLSDGIPNALYEAMASCTVPIVSPIDTLTPLFKDQENVIYADNMDIVEIVGAIKKAANDDKLADSIAEKNYAYIDSIAERDLVKSKVTRFYKDVTSPSTQPGESLLNRSILYVSDNDIDGGRFNGYDSLTSLHSLGWKTSFVTWEKKSNSPLVVSLHDSFLYRLLNAITKRLDSLFSVQRYFLLGYSFLKKMRQFQNASIVHLQLIHPSPFIGLKSLIQISRKKPTVWTLHDPWALTGHCVHPQDCDRWLSGCGSCPDLDRQIPLTRDTTRFMFNFKKDVYSKSSFDVVVASKWMQRLVSRSPLLKGKRVHLVPFGIDLNTFSPHNKAQLREQFGIPKNAFVIMFRNSKWKLKKADLIKKAISQLEDKKDIFIITTDAIGNHDQLDNSIPIIDFGWISKPEDLAKVYNLADIFVSPSFESFGMMALEAMACETAILYLKGSAVEDLCEGFEAGLSFREDSLDEIVNLIKKLQSSPDRLKDMQLSARKRAQDFSKESYISGLNTVYENILKRQNEEKNR